MSIRPMKYEPLVPWKPESARAKLKGDGVKVPGGSEEVGMGPWCWVPRTGNIGRGPVQANLMEEVGVKGNRGFCGKWRVFLLRIVKRPRCDARQRKRSPGKEVAEDVDGGKDKGHKEILE